MADDEKYDVVSLIFFKDWHELTKKHKLTKEQYGMEVYAMCEYCFYGIETELDAIEGSMFEMSKPYIKSSNRKKIEGPEGGKAPRGKAAIRFSCITKYEIGNTGIIFVIIAPVPRSKYIRLYGTSTIA